MAAADLCVLRREVTRLEEMFYERFESFRRHMRILAFLILLLYLLRQFDSQDSRRRTSQCSERRVRFRSRGFSVGHSYLRFAPSLTGTFYRLYFGCRDGQCNGI